MNNPIYRAMYIVIASLSLALFFNYLFFSKAIGVSVFIFAAVLVGTVFLFAYKLGKNLKQSWWLVGAIGFFAAMPTFRANEFLTFLNVCAVLGLCMLWSLQVTGQPIWLMKIKQYIKLFALMPFRMLYTALTTIGVMSRVHSTVKSRDTWVRVLKGVMMAIPILLVFALLFAQADLAFSQFIKQFISIDSTPRMIQYMVLLGFAFVSGLSFMSFTLQATTVPEDNKLTPVEPGRDIEVLVFLSLIGALFLFFIGFQITYLFGGEANIVTAGFTYAEYARRGFWELLFVAFLSLVLLFAAEKYSSTEGIVRRTFLIPALFVIAEVMVIVVSAFTRLHMYIDAYGMSLLRFYVAGFILLLLALFVLLAVKFIFGKQEKFFVFGALLSVVTFLAIINIANPDVFIARANQNRYQTSGKLDQNYLYSLSPDAESYKIEAYQRSLGTGDAVLQEWLRWDKEKLERENAHWQGFNLSRYKALKQLQQLE